MMDEVLRFNASEAPTKMGTFPQYDHPHTLARYAMVADYIGCGGNTDEEKFAALIAKIDELKAANPRYPLMSEIKQMYLNAYYGKKFVETAKPDAKQLEGRE